MEETSNTEQRVARPRNLTGDICYEVHSLNAYGLFTGRRNATGKPDIPGLYRFAKAMDLAYLDARRSKPYALWALCRVEEKLAEAHGVYDELLQQLQKKFDQPKVQLDRAVSSKPSRIPVKSTSPYPYMAGKLLIHADEVFCAVLQHRHIGDLGKEDAMKYHGIIHNKFRAVMEEGAGYRSLEITADDVRQGTEAYRAASDRYGAVPTTILSEEWTPQHGPEPLPETTVRVIKAFKPPANSAEVQQKRASA